MSELTIPLILSFCLLGVLVGYGGALLARYVRRAECPECYRWWTTRITKTKIINCMESRETIRRFDLFFDPLGSDIKRPGMGEVSRRFIGELTETRICSHCGHEWTIVRRTVPYTKL